MVLSTTTAASGRGNVPENVPELKTGSIILNKLPRLVEEYAGKAKHNRGKTTACWCLQTRGLQGLKDRFWVWFNAGIIVRLQPGLNVER